jgi:hypothetical protein
MKNVIIDNLLISVNGDSIFFDPIILINIVKFIVIHIVDFFIKYIFVLFIF